jgi:hypothetical protein
MDTDSNVNLIEMPVIQGARVDTAASDRGTTNVLFAETTEKATSILIDSDSLGGRKVAMTETSITHVPVPSSVRSTEPLWPKAVIAFGFGITIAWIYLLGYWTVALIEMAF